MWVNGFWSDGFWNTGFWDDSTPEPGGALNPLAIAVQGVGFGALLVAAQGFYGVGGAEPSSIHYETRGFMVNMGTFMGRM